MVCFYKQIINEHKNMQIFILVQTYKDCQKSVENFDVAMAIWERLQDILKIVAVRPAYKIANKKIQNFAGGFAKFYT